MVLFAKSYIYIIWHMGNSHGSERHDSSKKNTPQKTLSADTVLRGWRKEKVCDREKIYLHQDHSTTPHHNLTKKKVPRCAEPLLVTFMLHIHIHIHIYMYIYIYHIQPLTLKIKVFRLYVTAEKAFQKKFQ